MSEPITGELRRKIGTLGWYDEDGSIVFTTGGLPASDVACLAIDAETFGELCNRIDAEHERELRETGEEIVRDVKREWIHLPLDADGEPIHAGDVLDGYGKTIEVVELRHGRSGWVLISRDGNGYADTFAFTHHAPTVEDVLEEYRGRYYDLVTDMECKNITNDEYVQSVKLLNADFAAKLRLAGDAE